jgi:hypothetical protein
MNLARYFVRAVALLVLLNIGWGFCDCLRDPVLLEGRTDLLALLPPHDNSPGGGTQPCGDNCETCVCHAALVLSEPASFDILLAASGVPPSRPDPSSDPEYIGITHPPRV